MAASLKPDPNAGEATVGRQAGGRLARRKARTVSAILDASERHFLERGFESTKVDAIAGDADVSVGSLYNHFGGKESLYQAVVERALDLFETYMDEDRDTDLSPLEQTLDTAGRLARFARERPGQMRLLCLAENSDAQQEDLRHISDRVAKSMAARERRTAALIESAIRRGQVNPINARDAAAFLWSAWKGMLTLGPRAERARPGNDRELRALLEAGLRIVVGGLASDDARKHDETVRAILESTPSRSDAQRSDKEAPRPLTLERAPVASDLRTDFPELGIWTATFDARPADSPAAVERRLSEARERLTGADAIGTRSESTPWAYRVFARRLGIDPDSTDHPVEAAALQRLSHDGAGTLPGDAQLIAVAETGVPVLAFDADRIDGDLWLRQAGSGERVGTYPIEPGRPVIADRSQLLAAPFGPADESFAPGRETKRVTLVALQVKGVPDVGLEEALWTVVEITQAAR